MSDPDYEPEQVSKRTRFAKNKKKNWGKFDQAEIDAALEKKRDDEILHGGAIGEVKNEDLFVIDTAGKKKAEPKQTKRLTHTDRLLANKSMVPAPCPIDEKKMTNRALLIKGRKEINRAKTAHLRIAASKEKKTVTQFERERTSLASGYNLWASGSTPASVKPHRGTNMTNSRQFKPADHAKEMDGRGRARRPTNMKYKPDQAKKVKAVSVAHGGASYNPDYDEHQALLAQEHEKAEVVANFEAELKKKTKVPDDRVTEEDIFRESVAGLGILSDEEYQTDEDEADEDEAKPIKQPIRAEDRKDKKDRRKEQKQRKQTIRAQRRKRLRILMNQVYQVKKYKKELKKEQEGIVERRTFKQAKKETHMPRLSNIKWRAPDQDVKLTEELSESLRELVPEGNVLTDRYQSFVARAMIEPRNKHKQTRKFKVKYQQKRAFREFEEKMDKEIKADEARDAKQRKIQQQQKKE